MAPALSVTPKNLVPGTLLGTGAAVLYTAPSKATVHSLTIVNNDTVSHTVTVYLVPSAGSPGAANVIIKAVSIDAGQTLIDDTLRVLETGGTIQALASVASQVNLRADGSEVA